MMNRFSLSHLAAATMVVSVGLMVGAILTVSPTPSQAAKGGGGKTGDSGGNPSQVDVIAQFDPLGHVVGDQANLAYQDNNLNGGWSRMPGTGNFTLQLKTKKNPRTMEIHFTDILVDDPAYPDFPDDGIRNRTIFTSMNHYCQDSVDEAGVENYDPDDPNRPVPCNDFSLSEGSLKAMLVGGPDILINVRAFYEDQLDSKATIRFRCGPDRNNDIEEALTSNDLVLAHCEAGRSSDNACIEWILTPFNDDGTLSCRVTRTKHTKGTTTIETFGFYDLSFDLTLFRDENSNGSADINE